MLDKNVSFNGKPVAPKPKTPSKPATPSAPPKKQDPVRFTLGGQQIEVDTNGDNVDVEKAKNDAKANADEFAKAMQDALGLTGQESGDEILSAVNGLGLGVTASTLDQKSLEAQITALKEQAKGQISSEISTALSDATSAFDANNATITNYNNQIATLDNAMTDTELEKKFPYAAKVDTDYESIKADLAQVDGCTPEIIAKLEDKLSKLSVDDLNKLYGDTDSNHDDKSADAILDELGINTPAIRHNVLSLIKSQSAIAQEEQDRANVDKARADEKANLEGQKARLEGELKPFQDKVDGLSKAKSDAQANYDSAIDTKVLDLINNDVTGDLTALNGELYSMTYNNTASLNFDTINADLQKTSQDIDQTNLGDVLSGKATYERMTADNNARERYENAAAGVGREKGQYEQEAKKDTQEAKDAAKELLDSTALLKYYSGLMDD